MTVKKPAEVLEEAAAIYRQRGELYGDNYKHMGKVLMGLFPRGLTLSSEDDFNRFHLLCHRLNKESRYAQQFHQGGHEDSMIDLINYSAMTLECDLENKERKLDDEDPLINMIFAEVLSATKATEIAEMIHEKYHLTSKVAKE